MKKIILMILTLFMLIPLTSCSNLKKIEIMDIYVEKILLPLHNNEITDNELFEQYENVPLYEDGDISIYIDKLGSYPADYFEEFGIERVACKLYIYDGNNSIGSINMSEKVSYRRPDGSLVQTYDPETREDIIVAELENDEEYIQDLNQEFLIEKGYALVSKKYVTEYPMTREYLHDTPTTDKDRLFNRLIEDNMVPFGQPLEFFDKISVFRLKEGCTEILLDDSIPLYNFVYFLKNYDSNPYIDFEDFATTNVFYDESGKLHNQDRIYFANNKVYLDDSGVINLTYRGPYNFENYEEEILFQK